MKVVGLLLLLLVVCISPLHADQYVWKIGTEVNGGIDGVGTLGNGGYDFIYGPTTCTALTANSTQCSGHVPFGGGFAFLVVKPGGSVNDPTTWSDLLLANTSLYGQNWFLYDRPTGGDGMELVQQLINFQWLPGNYTSYGNPPPGFGSWFQFYLQAGVKQTQNGNYVNSYTFAGSPYTFEIYGGSDQRFLGPDRPSEVPEPASLGLLASGLVGVSQLVRRKLRA